MKDLIERLEQAVEGSRELDALIAFHVAAITPGITMHEDSKPGAEIFAFWQDGICHNCHRWAPFTQSLDAALTLAPEGWSVHLGFYSDHADCEMVKPTGRFLMEADVEVWAHNAKTGPLALCIAALQSRARRED